MPEPTSTTGAAGVAFVALVATVVGQKHGALVSVCLAAFGGAYIGLGEVRTSSRMAAFLYLVGYTLLGAMTAGAASLLIGKLTAVDANELLIGVAAVIGWVGGRWQALLNACIAAAQQLLGRGAPPPPAKEKP